MTAPRLLCFDFDGTIVDHEARTDQDLLSPQFLPTLRVLKKEGVLWAIATGRTLEHTLEGLRDFGVDAPDFLITKEREVYKPDSVPEAWLDFGDWNHKCDMALQQVFKAAEHFIDDLRLFLDKDTSAIYMETHHEPAGIVAEDDKEMDRICTYIGDKTSEVPELGYERNGRYLRFGHASFNKGSTLSELGRLLEIPPEHILAAGDNHNDISMLNGESAGFVACPGNALPNVKAVVEGLGGIVCKGRASHGLVEALEYHFE